MQQKLSSRGSGSFFLERTGQACGAVTDAVTSCNLPFRCPRCGDQERFCSLASLRAHLEFRHSYRSPDMNAGGFSITGKLPDPLMAVIPWYDMSLPTRRGQHSSWRPPHVRSLSDSRDGECLPSYSSARRRTQSVGVGTQAEEEEDEEEGTEDEDDEEDEEEDDRDGGSNDDHIKISTKRSNSGHRHFLFSSVAPLGPPPDLDLDQDLDLISTLSLLIQILSVNAVILSCHKSNPVTTTTTRPQPIHWSGDGCGLRGCETAAGQYSACSGQHHAAAPGPSEHRTGPD